MQWWKTPNQNSNKKKESKKSEDSLRGLWDNIKSKNIHILAVQDGEEREQEIEDLFEEIMTENFPNLVMEIEIQPRKFREFQTR